MVILTDAALGERGVTHGGRKMASKRLMRRLAALVALLGSLVLSPTAGATIRLTCIVGSWNVFE